MDFYRSVLDNYLLLEEEVYINSTINQLIDRWRLECQSIRLNVHFVEKPKQNTRLHLVRQ